MWYKLIVMVRAEVKSHHAEYAAKWIAHYIDAPVGIDAAGGITFGNVTFGVDEVRRLSYHGMLDVNTAMSGYDPESHSAFDSESVGDGWIQQSQRESERPTNFVKLIQPPSKTTRLARKILLGK